MEVAAALTRLVEERQQTQERLDAMQAALDSVAAGFRDGAERRARQARNAFYLALAAVAVALVAVLVATVL
jgi:putative Mn2+ efflux pump MntP